MSAATATLRTLLLLVPWAAGTACSGSLFAPANGDDLADGDTDADAGSPSDTGLGGPIVDSVWGVGGLLTLTAGDPSPGLSALLLQTRGRECTVRGTVVQVAPVDTTLRGVTQLWNVLVEPDGDASCTWRGPTDLLLGLGETDAQLAPAAARAGVDLNAALGLYLGATGGDVFLVGVATPGPVMGPGDTGDSGTGTDSGDTASTADSADSGGDTADTATDTAADTGDDDTDALDTGGPTAPADGPYGLLTLHGIPLDR